MTGGATHWYREREVVLEACTLGTGRPGQPQVLVGSIVRAVPGADPDLCLGAPGCGLTGRVAADDSSGMPFAVVCNGRTCWYRRQDVEVVPAAEASAAAAAPTARPGRLAVGTRVRSTGTVDPDLCLGPAGNGIMTGVVVEDDGADDEAGLPYHVRCEQTEEMHWYRGSQLEVIT